MRFVIVTGMSGAGKSSVLKMLEDIGYFCVDNLPIPLVPKLGELLVKQDSHFEKIALGMDIRSGQSLKETQAAVTELKKMQLPCEILFLDASDPILIKRFKETRRSHPLSGNGRVDLGIEQERKELEFLRKEATWILDTSRMLTRDLKAEINKIFLENKNYKNLYVTILSFGFKYGIPQDADLVFDVRFLPNPYYIEELRKQTGNDKPVRDYVMQDEKAVLFLNKLTDMIQFLLPNYIAEGKTQLVIGVGCTGGQHRSVTIANALFEKLNETQEEYGIKIEHRDIKKDSVTKAK